MKKLLLSTVVLLLFSLSLLIFQISCKKEAIAEESNYLLPPATTSTLGGIIVGNGLNIDTGGTLSLKSSPTVQHDKLVYIKRNVKEIWTANYDGTNQQKLNIGLPPETRPLQLSVSPDGQTLIFIVNTATDLTAIYSCNIDGTELKEIIDGSEEGMDGLTYVCAY